jgi:hypothetical protein
VEVFSGASVWGSLLALPKNVRQLANILDYLASSSIMAKMSFRIWNPVINVQQQQQQQIGVSEQEAK